jgi:hypothetical protein
MPSTVFTQTISKAFGIRAGQTSGLVYHAPINEDRMIMSIFGPRDGGLVLTCLATTEHNFPMPLPKNCHFYIGFGGHLGYFKDQPDPEDNYHKRYLPSIGVDALAGFEYFLTIYPVSLSIDVKPYVNILGPYNFFSGLNDIGFSIKYNF